MILFYARKRYATCSSDDKLTTGSVGVEVIFHFSDDWAAAPARIAVFRGSGQTVDVLLNEDSCTMPPEVLTQPGSTLTIGVYGTDGAGTVVIPTVYAEAGRIARGAEPSGIKPTPQTQPLIDQLLAAAKAARDAAAAAERLAQSVRDDADAGKFDGKNGADGYAPEVTIEQIDGGHRVTITSADYPEGQSFDVINGAQGPQGPGVTEDLRAALLQLARKVAYIDDQGETYYQDLYDALYQPKELVSISAVFTQGQTVIYDTANLDSLKQMLVVTGTYDDQSTETIPSTDYTISGTLTPGTSTITVTCDGKTTTFTVQVTHQPGVYAVTNNLTGCVNSNSASSVTEGDSYSGTISASAGYMMTGATVSITMGGVDITSTAYSNGTISIASVTGVLVISVTAVAVTLSFISADYTQSGTVYDTDTLDSLKADLVVTAHYSDSSTATVAADAYTLSGELTEGTSTITVSYSGKAATFNVTVTANPVYGFIETGSPDIRGNILYPESGTGSIRSRREFSPSGPWKLRIKVNPTTFNANSNIFMIADASGERVRSFQMQAIYSSSNGLQLLFYLSSNGTSWNIKSGTGFTKVDGERIVEFEFTGSQYRYRFSENNGSTWSVWTVGVETTAKIFGSGYFTLGTESGVTPPFKGSIDLADLEVWQDGVLWWKAVQN